MLPTPTANTRKAYPNLYKLELAKDELWYYSSLAILQATIRLRALIVNCGLTIVVEGIMDASAT
jgi:hypothetical protein